MIKRTKESLKKRSRMSSLLKSKIMFSLVTFSLVSLFSSTLFSLSASECCGCPEPGRLYIGAFGGGLYSDSTRIDQLGTAFFTEAEGGPLAVIAEGHSKKNSSGFGGVQLGYEWSPRSFGCSNWSLSPALEAEAFWHRHTSKGHLINPTARLPEHDFYDTFHVNAGVYLVNAVVSLNHDCLGSFAPYVGAGVGGTRLSLKNASSLQVSPPEEGINHFNSRRSDSSWAFVAQLKAGLRYKICDSFHLFGEYRYLWVDSSNYIFGSTNYETHAPTTPWNVKVHNTHYNAFVVGLQYDL